MIERAALWPLVLNIRDQVIEPSRKPLPCVNHELTRVRGQPAVGAYSASAEGPLLPTTRDCERVHDGGNVPSTRSPPGYGCRNWNRGKSWVNTAIFCGLDQMSVTSSASVAVSSEMSADAELCIASATIRTSVVVSRTAE
jgi:hypothetical protein